MPITEWLMVETPDGAPYVQVVILLTIFVLLIRYSLPTIVRELKEIYVAFQEELKK